MQMIGAAPAMDILAALGKRSAPTKQLAGGVEGFSARSVYRSLAMLEAHLLVEREANPDGRPGAVNRLTEAGRLLLDCIPARAPLRPLGELWGLGLVERLSHGPRPLLELAEGAEGLSYHQVRHRLIRFCETGLLADSPHDGMERRFQLSDTARSLMGVVAGVGRWRRRCSVAGSTPGLDAEETATVLRTLLPLAVPPEHPVDFFVTEPDGVVAVTAAPEREAAGFASAAIDAWFAVLLDGDRGRVRVGGDLDLVDGCLTQLHEVLRRA
jgi:DNA-binding transcriptional ArsR family regulator